MLFNPLNFRSDLRTHAYTNFQFGSIFKTILLGQKKFLLNVRTTKLTRLSRTDLDRLAMGRVRPDPW